MNNNNNKLSLSERNTAEYKLVVSSRSGDSDAFSILYGKYKSIIYGYISSLSVPLSEKDDLFQEGLIGLLKAVRSYDNESSSFATYASLCIKRSIISALRKYNRNYRYELSADPTATSLNMDYVPSPEADVVERESVHERYINFIGSLSSYETQTFTLYIKGWSYSAMAEKLSCSEKSIDNAMTRIKSKMKKWMKS